MTATEEDPTTGEVPAQPAPPVYLERPKRVFQFNWVALCGTIIVVLVLGFVGGLVAQGLFPAHTGATGKTGKTGATGAAGPIGPTGSAANVSAELAQLGVCVNVNYNYSGVSYVSGVSVTTPTETNGTQSCPNGTFTPVQAAPAPAPTQ